MLGLVAWRGISLSPLEMTAGLQIPKEFVNFLREYAAFRDKAAFFFLCDKGHWSNQIASPSKNSTQSLVLRSKVVAGFSAWD